MLLVENLNDSQGMLDRFYYARMHKDLKINLSYTKVIVFNKKNRGNNCRARECKRKGESGLIESFSLEERWEMDGKTSRGRT